LSDRISGGGNGRVNPPGEGGGIGIITGAYDDPGVSALGIPVEADEVEAVLGPHDTSLLRGKIQDLIIGSFLIRTSRLERG